MDTSTNYDEIKKIFKNHSRSTKKNKSNRAQSLATSPKSPTPSISRFELGTMLEGTKTNILHSVAMKMDNMQFKMKGEEIEKGLVVLCPKCRKKHGKNGCPLMLWMFVGYVL